MSTLTPGQGATRPVEPNVFGEMCGRGAQPHVTEQYVVGKLARKVVQWGLTVPAILTLEVHRPLSFMASQAMHMLTPFVSMFLDAREFVVLAKMLERRESIEDVICAIEDEEARKQEAARTAKVAR